jgi:hypothetical protein
VIVILILIGRTLEPMREFAKEKFIQGVFRCSELPLNAAHLNLIRRW